MVGGAEPVPFDIRNFRPIAGIIMRFALRRIVAPLFQPGRDGPASGSCGVRSGRRRALVGGPARPYISGLGSTTRKEVILCLTTNRGLPLP